MTASPNDSVELPRSPGRWVVVGVLTLLAVVLVLQRLRTYGEPIERDIAGYAVIAHEMLHGRHLYSDLWERKPPLLYATFAVAELICGYGPREISLLNISAAIATLIGLYFVGRGLARSSTAGLCAAGFWMLIGGDMYTQANQPNAEVFVNACLTAAFALLVNWPRSRQVLSSLLLGTLFLATTLYKHHVVITCATLSAAHLLSGCFSPVDRRRSEITARLKNIATAAAVVTTGWAAMAGYFWLNGSLPSFVDVLFRQNVTYSGNVTRNILGAFLPGNLFPGFVLWLFGILPLVIVAGLIERGWMGRPVNSRLMLWIAWSIGTAITVALPGQMLGHYYQLWIPVWCAAGGWAVTVLIREQRPRLQLVSRLLLGSAVGCILLCQAKHYLLSADEWARRKYPHDHFVQQRQMGYRLAQLLSPGQSFYNLGEDNPLYFYSGHAPASGLLYLSPLDPGPEAGQYEKRLLNDLNRSMPDLIVVSARGEKTLSQHPALSAWIGKNYIERTGTLGTPIYRVLLKPDSLMARDPSPSPGRFAVVRDED